MSFLASRKALPSRMVPACQPPPEGLAPSLGRRAAGIGAGLAHDRKLISPASPARATNRRKRCEESTLPPVGLSRRIPDRTPCGEVVPFADMGAKRISRRA